MTRLCAPVKPDVDLLEMDGVVYGKNAPTIAAYHNFEKTPDLEPILKQLQRDHPHADLYKIATMARSTLDGLCMLEFLQQHRNVIGLCMGDLGTITRICAPVFGVPLTYAPLHAHEKNAPGQLTVDELCLVYNFRALNPETRLYGLIGDPVHKSIGHLFHNDYFRRHALNAVYVKMVVKPHELALFFAHLKKLPFAGLSVTAPLKEAILPYVDILDFDAAAIGAVNTLILKEGKVWGFNTDGEAALQAIGPVAGKTVVVVGAGGVARAVIYTALQQGARITVVNRTASKARKLARDFHCDWSPRIPPHDILVNATPTYLPGPKAVNLTQNWTMYFQQALAQQAIWGQQATTTSSLFVH